MTYTIPDFGPSDLLTSNIEGQRRVKVQSEISGTVPVSGSVSIENTDPSGNIGRNTTTQETLIAWRTDHVNVQFQYNVPVNVDSGDVVGVSSGLGNLSHTNSMAVVSSGNGAGDYALTSRDSIRYFPGHEFAEEMTAFCTGANDAGALAMWGIGDFGTTTGDAMGFAVVDGQLYAVFKTGGVTTLIPRTNFNRNTIAGVDFTKLNLWTLRGGWYGILPLQWGIYYNGKYITCHILDLSNAQQKPHLSNPTLPIFVQAKRTSGTGEVKVYTASWRGGICGETPKRTKADRTFNVSIEGKAISAGVTTPIVTLRNNATFQGKVNHVRVRYGTIALSDDGTKDVVWEVFKGGSLVGGAFVPKNAITSVIDYNITATSFTPLGDNIGGTVLGKTGQTRINLFEGDVVLAVYPGETITLTARSANNATVSVFFRWIEEF